MEVITALFGVLNANSCLMKLETGNAGVWHLNASALAFKPWQLVFMKLTPGGEGQSRLNTSKAVKTQSF